MPTQLQPFTPVLPAGLVDLEQFRAEVVAELRSQILADIEIHVDPPQLAAPNVTVNVPEAEPPDVQVTVSMEALSTQLAQTNNLLGIIVNLLGQQVTKTVKRNASGTIEEVVETRG